MRSADAKADGQNRPGRLPGAGLYADQAPRRAGGLQRFSRRRRRRSGSGSTCSAVRASTSFCSTSCIPEELELPALAAARFLETEGGHGHFNAEPDAVRALYRAPLRGVPAGDQGRLPGARVRLVPGEDLRRSRTRFLRNCFLEREAMT